MDVCHINIRKIYTEDSPTICTSFYINIFHNIFNKIKNSLLPGHELPSTLIYSKCLQYIYIYNSLLLGHEPPSTLIYSTIPLIKYIIPYYQGKKPVLYKYILQYLLLTGVPEDRL